MRLLCRVPVSARLALGFLFAGLVVMLTSGFVGLQYPQALSQADLFQKQVNAANAELTTALALLQEEDTRVQTTLEDAADGQPRSVLLSDQEAVQSLVTRYEAEIGAFMREHLLAQQPIQQEWLNELGQGEVIGWQHGLVLSLNYTWQRCHAAQMQVLQDILAGKIHAAEMLAHAQANPMETDVLSALDSLIQFENGLALSVQNATRVQAAHDQGMVTLLVTSTALLVIALIGVLVTISLLGPMHRLHQGIRAAASGEWETRIDIVGHDEIAAISARVNDLFVAVDGLLAEVSRQQDRVVSAAERLISEVSGGDPRAVQAQLAEVGDPLSVLDMVCTEVIARFHYAAASAP